MPHEENRGGRREPDGQPRPPAGPGRFANRQDLSQPARVPEGPMPHGTKKRLREGQQASPVPKRKASIPLPPTSQTGQGAAVPSMRDILGRPTDRPDEPITAQPPPDHFQIPAGQRVLSNTLDLVLQSVENPSAELVDLYLSLRRGEVS